MARKSRDRIEMEERRAKLDAEAEELRERAFELEAQALEKEAISAAFLDAMIASGNKDDDEQQEDGDG
jgi:hypothetical protein